MPTLAPKKRDELLLLLSLLREEDFHRARATWDRLAPANFRGLLDARTDAGQRFRWQPDAAQFARGEQTISRVTVRNALNVFNQRHAAELAQLGATVTAQAGIAVPQWQAAMERAVKDAQIVNAAVGRGGIEALTDTDAAKVEESVQFHLGRLGRFADQLDTEAVEQKAAARRAAAYAQSAITIYDRMNRRAADVAGFTKERNILHPAEHCFSRPEDTRPDCPSLTEMGWVKLGELTPIGGRICLWNCKCSIAFGR